MGVYHYPVIKEWIHGLPQESYRDGVGKYIGVVIHYTCNEHDTAQGEANYESTTFSNAFVDEFIDANQIIQVADPNYLCYGCGGEGNQLFVQIEMCHADTQADFDAIFDKTCERTAEYLAARHLGVSRAKPDKTGTVWSHLDVPKYLGGTDHTDPDEFLHRWGKSMDELVARAKIYYDGLLASNAPSTPPTPTPAQPSDKTLILGAAVATVDQMRLYLKRLNPDAPDYAQLYLDEGAKIGVRGDLAFIQTIHETGRFTFKRPDGTPGDVSVDQNNFCGLGAIGGGAKGASFDTPELGIEAQMEHLYGYATTADLPVNVPIVDPRFAILKSASKRGIAPYWEDLDGKWAVPGVGYGESIVAAWKDLCSITEAELAEDYVKSTGLMVGYPDGQFHGGDPITRDQLAAVLYRLSKQTKGGN